MAASRPPRRTHRVGGAGSRVAGVRQHCGAPAGGGSLRRGPGAVLYALAGSSRHLIVGPMSATAALSAAIIMPVAHGDSVRYFALSTALAICAGLAGMLAALLRLGFIASFISEPVLKGFISLAWP